MSALVIHFLFMGVSRVTGSKATAREFSGSPEPGAARLEVNWCTAAWSNIKYRR